MTTTKSKTKKTTATAETNAPNIQFCGKYSQSNGKTVAMDAPGEVVISNETIKLPSDAKQKAGFYLPGKQASQIMRMYQHLYKRPVMKDGKPVPFSVPHEIAAKSAPKKKAVKPKAKKAVNAVPQSEPKTMPAQIVAQSEAQTDGK